MTKKGSFLSRALLSFSLIMSLCATVPAFASTTITDGQKEEYYQEYETIVKEIAAESGTTVRLLPMNEFTEWKTPEDFRKTVEDMVYGQFIITDGLQTKSTGSKTKNATISVNDGNYTIAVTASFTTQYSSVYDRQMFATCDSVSSKKVGNMGSWEQWSWEAAKTDAGRTYKVVVSGDFTVAGIVATRTAAIYYYCNSAGAIS